MSSVQSKISLVCIYVLGFIYLASGVAGLLNLIPPPPDMPVALQTFMTGLMAAKYFFPFLKITEVICGLLLLVGFFRPLTLIILAPITLNILGVHAFLTPTFDQLILPIFMVVLHVVSATRFKEVYRPLLQK